MLLNGVSNFGLPADFAVLVRCDRGVSHHWSAALPTRRDIVKGQAGRSTYSRVGKVD